MHELPDWRIRDLAAGAGGERKHQGFGKRGRKVEKEPCQGAVVRIVRRYRNLKGRTSAKLKFLFDKSVEKTLYAWIKVSLSLQSLEAIWNRLRGAVLILHSKKHVPSYNQTTILDLYSFISNCDVLKEGWGSKRK